MAVWLKANGEIQVVNPKAKKFGLEELQGFVGGYIEIVVPKVQGLQLFHHSDRDATTAYEITKKTVMVVNDAGLIKNLPVNQIATAIYPEPTGIRGDVLLCLRGQEIT